MSKHKKPSKNNRVNILMDKVNKTYDDSVALVGTYRDNALSSISEFQKSLKQKLMKDPKNERTLVYVNDLYNEICTDIVETTRRTIRNLDRLYDKANSTCAVVAYLKEKEAEDAIRGYRGTMKRLTAELSQELGKYADRVYYFQQMMGYINYDRKTIKIVAKFLKTSISENMENLTTF